MNSKDNKNISLNKNTLSELVDLVDHHEKDSMNVIFRKILNDFNMMSNCLEKNGLLDDLHPEWKYDSTQYNNSLYFKKLENLFEDKVEK